MSLLAPLTAVFMSIVVFGGALAILPARAADSPAPRPSQHIRLPFLRRYAQPARTPAKASSRPDVRTARPTGRSVSRSPASQHHGKTAKSRPARPAANRHATHTRPPVRQPTPRPTLNSAPRTAVVNSSANTTPPTDPTRQPARVVPAAPPPAYASSPTTNTPLKLSPLPLRTPTSNGREPGRTIRLDMTRPYLDNSR